MDNTGIQQQERQSSEINMGSYERPDREHIYYVNGERQETSKSELTVRVILDRAGFTPPEEYRLIRDENHHEYRDMNEEVRIHQDEKFTALFEGPTPTS